MWRGAAPKHAAQPPREREASQAARTELSDRAQPGDRLGSRQDPAEFRIEVRRRDPGKLVSGDRASLGVVI